MLDTGADKVVVRVIGDGKVESELVEVTEEEVGAVDEKGVLSVVAMLVEFKDTVADVVAEAVFTLPDASLLAVEKEVMIDVVLPWEEAATVTEETPEAVEDCETESVVEDGSREVGDAAVAVSTAGVEVIVAVGTKLEAADVVVAEPGVTEGVDEDEASVELAANAEVELDTTSVEKDAEVEEEGGEDMGVVRVVELSSAALDMAGKEVEPDEDAVTVIDEVASTDNEGEGSESVPAAPVDGAEVGGATEDEVPDVIDDDGAAATVVLKVEDVLEMVDVGWGLTKEVVDVTSTDADDEVELLSVGAGGRHSGPPTGARRSHTCGRAAEQDKSFQPPGNDFGRDDDCMDTQNSRLLKLFGSKGRSSDPPNHRQSTPGVQQTVGRGTVAKHP